MIRANQEEYLHCLNKAGPSYSDFYKVNNLNGVSNYHNIAYFKGWLAPFSDCDSVWMHPIKHIRWIKVEKSTRKITKNCQKVTATQCK